MRTWRNSVGRWLGVAVLGGLVLGLPVLVGPLGPGAAAGASPAGTVLAFGSAPDLGSLSGQDLAAQIVGLARTPSGQGYWLVASDGGVFSFGDARFFGSTGGLALNRPVVGMAASPSGQGYWLVASDGGVFSFGDARFFGSTGGLALNRPVVGMAASPSGQGYWLVASDGGVFSFGDAGFFGSTGGLALNRPVVGMAASPSGQGYWLVASDGGVFSFGDARFFGSTGGLALNRPVVGMAASPSGQGYWLVASDGGVFNFGDAGFFGSAGGTPLARPVVGLAAAPDGHGYWMAEGERLAGRVVVLDPGHNGGNAAHPEIINQPVDIINGQKACDTTGASTDSGYPEWAFNLDVAQRAAAMLAQEGATVILTRTDSNGVGPCISERAAIGNRAGADAAVSIHADGGPAGGRGFHVIMPGAVAGADGAILQPSGALGTTLRDTYLAESGEPTADYVASNGLDTRTDLGGLNLSTVPKVFIECANMRNGTDASAIVDPAGRQRMAGAIADGITRFLN